METLIPLAIHLIAGVIGGNIAGLVLKRFSLGPVGNSLAGIVGGVLGGQLLNRVGDLLGGFAGDVVVGGIGGAVLMIAVGIIRKLVGNQDSPRHR